MLKRLDPSNPVLQAYLKTSDSSIPIGILLPREAKKTKKSKKDEPTSPENVAVTVEATKVITPIVEESQKMWLFLRKHGCFEE